MAPSSEKENASTPPTSDALRNWIMVVLTLIFVSLYAAALLGWLKPLADEKMVLRLEPIIFVIIGYFFFRRYFYFSGFGNVSISNNSH